MSKTKPSTLEEYRKLNKSKTDNMSFRVDPEFKKAIKIAAGEAGMNMAEYVCYATFLRRKGCFNNQIQKENTSDQLKISKYRIQTELNKIRDGIDIYGSVRNIEEEMQSWL